MHRFLSLFSFCTQVSVYDPCRYRDLNYESLLSNFSYEELLKRNTDHNELKTCTLWQFNTTEFGDTITSEVILILLKINEINERF